ncbi:MAG: translocation/assembly module TamB domain-containing protein [Terriglobales bacterium]
MRWKRIIGWTAGIIFGLIVILFAGGYFVLRSDDFHHYVLAKIVQQGNEATGGKVEVRNFDFRFSTLTAHLYGIVIHGTEPSNARPLLQVDEITVGLKILSVLRRRVNLSELLIEHPIVNLMVDKNGRSNIPEPNAPKNKSSRTNVFDLAVGHVLLSDGEVDYNDRKSAMDADVRDLRAETHFNSLSTSYEGSVSYHDGHIQYGSISPLPHSLVAQFTANPSTLTLPSLVLTVGSSRVSLQAKVSDYSNPKVDGAYDMRVHTQDVAGLAAGMKPVGDVFFSGKLAYQSRPGDPFLRDVTLEGMLTGDDLGIATSRARVKFRKLTSHYQMANGNFQTRDFAAELLNGQVVAKLDVQHLDAHPSSRFHVAMNGISLQDVKKSVNNSSAKTVPLTGSLQGVVDASWTGAFRNLLARSDLEIHGTATNSEVATAIPINGVVHITYDEPRNIIALRRTTIRTPRSSVMANGEIGEHSNLIVQASTSDLGELAMIETLVRPNVTPTGQYATPLSLSGSATVNATVRGSLKEPAISAQVSAHNLTVEGSEWRTLAFVAAASPGGIFLRDGSLVSAHQGQISFSASAGLRDWSYTPSSPIAANISVKQMQAAQIEQLARLRYPIEGDISGDVTLRGNQLNPVGNGSLRLTKARVENEPIQDLAVKFKAANGSVDSSLKVNLPAGSATANFSYVPKTKAYKLELHSPGIVLSRLQTVQRRNLPLNGTLQISASGRGTLDNPNLTAMIQLPEVQVRQNSITGIKASINIANRRANMSLTSDVAQSTVRARATVNLTGDYYTDAAVDTTKIPLEPLLALYVPNHPAGFLGTTELHATLKGPLKNRARIEAHIVVPTLTASYQTVQIRNTGPIRLDYANSVIILQPTEFKGTDSELQLQGRIPIGGAEALKTTVKGSVNLRLLQIFDPQAKTSGMVTLDVRTQGTTAHPVVQGEIRLNDASFYTVFAPVGMSHASGVFDVSSDQLRITQFSGQVGGGEVSAGGTITYRPQVQFNMAVQAKSVRLLYPEGLRTVLNGNIDLTGNRSDAVLEGRVLIDSLSFTPDFDLATFMNQFTGPSVPPASQTFADAVKLDVSIQSAGELAATSSQVSLQGEANLRAIGTAANPVIVGRADINSGDVFFLNNRYQLQRGVFTFNNPNQTQPIVNVAATTTIQQYNLTLNVNGPLDKLQTNYVSDPPLSTVDIINLIARGQTTQQADTTNLSANSLIAQGVASRLSSGVQKLAGLSSLSIDPLLGGNNTNPSARIAVQQRVTKNFLFTFSTDVTQPQSEIVQGEYQLSKRWSVSVDRSASGGVAVDGKFHTTF